MGTEIRITGRRFGLIVFINSVSWKTSYYYL